ncbi:MAG: hypothetical protein KDD82_15430 [Planctomycetes bacterium]|nr:hypothetical protein [Planctomycetota bacterium]
MRHKEFFETHEAYALGADRDAFLEQLIPGSEDHYYYRCLELQHQGQLDGVAPEVEKWVDRHGRTQRVREIERRQLLLRWNHDDRETFRREYGLSFTHQPDLPGAEAVLPTALDPQLVDPDYLFGRAFSSHGVSGIHDAALERLLLAGVTGWSDDRDYQEGVEALAPSDPAVHEALRRSLKIGELRELLERLQRPDHPRIVELVLHELRHKKSRGFGSLKVHGLLLDAQLEELAERRPALLEDERFVHANLIKLQPNPDVAWEHHPAEREAYLERLWAFVSALKPAFNSLKAHVLYHRLAFDRRMRLHDRARFLSYLALPRQVDYVEPVYLRHEDRKRVIASLTQDYRSYTLLAPVGNDEELVRHYLEHFWRQGEALDLARDYVREHTLRRWHAELRILEGLGDPEENYSLLDDPSGYQRLKERVDLYFLLENPETFAAEQAVTLEFAVKNVTTLLVKVFRINALNYALAHGRDVDTAIDLDGLVAAHEQALTFPDEALRRRRERLELPALAEPGTYVVELIGGGRSSRAVIRKGCLRFVERVGAAGHVLTVLDERDQVLSDASVWLAGREYSPRQDGTVLIPFSERPGQRTILLRHGSVVTVERLQQKDERFEFEAGFFVEREQLVHEGTAELVIRPRLTLHGEPVSLELLEEVALEVQAGDLDGTTTTQVERGLSWSDAEETVHGFKVPPRLQQLSFVLRGTVKGAFGKEYPVSAVRSLSLNGIEREACTTGVHLVRSAEGYALHVLGKNGEPRVGVAVSAQLHYRDYALTTHSRLKTDPQGVVQLGSLAGVARLEANTPDGGESAVWSLARAPWEVPDTLQAPAGAKLQVPHLGTADGPDRSALSLLERRGASFVRDVASCVSLRDGAWVLTDLPPGDYELFLKEPQRAVKIRITRGSPVAGWAVGARRQLECSAPRVVHLPAAEVTPDAVRFRVANASPATRVHVFATRFVPREHLADALLEVPRALRRTEVSPLESAYLNGRELGDEYRYVLDRRLQPQFPGNLLSRPGLILNPWSRQDTSTELQDARGGDAFGSSASRKSREEGKDLPSQKPYAGGGGERACFDFLEHPACLRKNLRPDAEGWVSVPRAALHGQTLLRAVAVDPRGVAARDALLPAAPLAGRDLRLLLDFEAEVPYAQRREVDLLQPGDELVIEDLVTAKMERYDTLRRVFDYFLAQGSDSRLAEFEFLLRWPQLSEEEQREKYGRYACHELHLFLFRKDPRFFGEVVRPYLTNKLHKTFLDRWLLGEDLSRYHASWAFSQLNTLEKILLGRRGDPGPVARQVGDVCDLSPRDPDAEASWFRAALGNRGLAEDDLGFDAAKSAATSESRARRAAPKAKKMAAPMRAMSMAMPPPAPSAQAAGYGGSMDDMMDMECLAEAALPMEAWDEAEECDDSDDYYMEKESAKRDDVVELGRSSLTALYRAPEKTQELAEQNYYRVLLEQQGPELITPNAFWRDFAAHREGPFCSAHFVRATNRLCEMLCALALLDLPFDAEKPEVSFQGGRCTLRAGTPLLVFHEEIKPTVPAEEPVPILVSQNFFRADDRYRYDETGEQRDNYVRDEFLTHVVYLSQVVLTNPTSSPQKLELLLQIPRGAIPVAAGFRTRGRTLLLSSYQTESIEFAFYFPEPGEFPYYPAHVSKDEALVARAEPGVLRVVSTPSKVDETSWEYVSQQGTLEQVLAYLQRENLGRVDLSRVAWRLKERKAYDAILGALEARLAYDATLWSYAVHHGDTPRAAEFLKHHDQVVRDLGGAFFSSWLELDPVERRSYEHLEYDPLINARAHPLGGSRAILNDRFEGHYRAFLERLRYHPQLRDRDWLEGVIYLLLQDRIAEALEALARVRTDAVEAGLQLDYLRAYLAFFTRELERAERIANLHAEHPVPRWRERFQRALAHIEEARGVAPELADPGDRDARQEDQARREPGFELEVSSDGILVSSKNLETLTLNLYRMDIELLFSRQPFVQQETDQFSFVEPNLSETLRLDSSGETRVEVPEELAGQNLVVELVGVGRREAKVHYANRLRVQLAPNMGQLSVAARESGAPEVGVYVKVYARRRGGETRFYKDGYTDHRGRFDYASLSTDDLDATERFAILVLSDERGAVIREAAPPAR